MDESIKARARLWLRGEQAMGLESVPIRIAEPAPPSPAPAPARPAPVARPVAPPPAPAASPPLFTEAFTSPVMPRAEKVRCLAELDTSQVKPCTRCDLCKQRKNTVFGEGDPDARIFFVGEGPGEDEDRTGRPFVGRAGQKLDEMIHAMGLRREQVFIGNIVKCRPPGNRTPLPDEAATCMPYLVRQIEVIRPAVIVLLGGTASKYLLQAQIGITRLRGLWQTWRGVRVMPTFHPSYILRNYTVETRRAVWSDLQKVMAEVGIKK